MARYTVPPTKTNLLRLKAERAFVLEGHQLLEQKKDILTAELLALVDTARVAEEQMDKALAVAFQSLKNGLVRMGTNPLHQVAGAVADTASVSVATRRVMGVVLPSVTITAPEASLDYSLGETSFWVDEVRLRFVEAAKLLGALTETKASLARLSVEVRKTIRRVNALEKIAIPDLEDTVKYIAESLEEMERETFFIMKMIKNRLAERRSCRGRS
jgi:V/A-type H+-transporting ATPase subunit D